MCRNRRQLSYTLALQSVVRSAPTGGWPQLRLVNLVPPFLEHLGRSSALQSLVRPLVIVEAQVDSDAGATALYWLTQESSADVLKPAAASRADVTLSYEARQIRLNVVDDGQGFDISLVARSHGLENMNRRTGELDGSVTIDSVLGEGTGVTVTLPA